VPQRPAESHAETTRVKVLRAHRGAQAFMEEMQAISKNCEDRSSIKVTTVYCKCIRRTSNLMPWSIVHAVCLLANARATAHVQFVCAVVGANLLVSQTRHTQQRLLRAPHLLYL
jgi:hypothetical protein